MVRLAPVALLFAIVAAPGWSQSTGPIPKHLSREAWRSGEPAVPQPRYALPDYSAGTDDGSPGRLFAGTEFTPNSRLGLGFSARSAAVRPCRR
jgi:hypothetical protein